MCSPDFHIEALQKGQVILVDKPLEWTSFDVINHLRSFIKRNLGIPKIKMGHAGTLDPLATGLLIVCAGKMTKRVDEFQAQEKEYEGSITLGATRPSFDCETEIDKTFPLDDINEEDIRRCMAKFVGIQKQTPPVYSAIKIKGKRAYDYARKNQKVEIKSREIEIRALEITRIEMPVINFRLVCSKGTYVRSLARDFGEELNNGAYLSSLKRTRIGNFRLEDALSMETIREKVVESNPPKEPKSTNP